jgi:prepilin-type N-terminal cleavage/methylation domain-containing protein
MIHLSAHHRPPRRSAFTLVELLVVIAIISILMTAGSIGLSGIGGKGVTGGVSTVESLFDEARTTAMGKNIRAAVLVAKTLDNNPAEDLRRVLVAYEETDPTTGEPVSPDSDSPNWVLSSRGALLPEQTFFSAKFSAKDQTSGQPLDEISSSRITGVKRSYEGTYYLYVFNAQGMMQTPGASFVIGSGARNPSTPSTSQPPRVTASAKRDFGGFVVWRNGGTSVFRSPDQMAAGIRSIQPGDTF